MIVSAFGLSLVVFAPLAKSMLSGLGVPVTFLLFGVVFLTVCSICALVLQNPPEDHLPKGYSPPAQAAAKRQYSPLEIIKTKQFYFLAAGLLLTLPAYFILNPIFLSLGGARGLSDELAVLGVALTGISSAAGRLIVPWLSDRIGPKAAAVANTLIIMAASLVMISANGVLFLICIMFVSFGFGGTASVYSVMTAENFGTKYGGMNFGLVMTGFGISALIFPVISNALASGGSYTGSFILAAATCPIAVVLVLLRKKI
jgi:OFA family oxalate/formate antiporter-like MFS transporter